MNTSNLNDRKLRHIAKIKNNKTDISITLGMLMTINDKMQ